MILRMQHRCYSTRRGPVATGTARAPHPSRRAGHLLQLRWRRTRNPSATKLERGEGEEMDPADLRRYAKISVTNADTCGPTKERRSKPRHGDSLVLSNHCLHRQ